MEEKNTQCYEDEIKFLRRRVVVLDGRWKTASARLATLQKKYSALSKSLLGRTQLLIWKVGSCLGRTLYAIYLKIKKALLKCGITLPSKKIEDTKQEGMAEKNRIAQNKRSLISIIDKKQENLKQGLLPEFMNEAVIMNDVYRFDWQEKYLELREQICDVDFQQRMRDKIAQIPESNGSKYYGKMPYKIGIIADEFLFRSYVDAAEFQYITPENYKYDVDYLFVATAWKGLNGEWKGLGSIQKADVRNKLYNIIDYYRNLGKKVIFYSKEDPSNYYVFLDIAKKCDCIFTTAEECVKHYKEDTGIENVNVLDFAINPVQFNPIGSQMYNFDEVLFAGTWWNKKYPERKEDMEIIFQSVIKANKGLKLIDRNYSMGNPDYFYPEKYLRFVSPELSHATLQKVHKMYSWSININSIKNSKTMFASRVYELQALGNLIISNHSEGMEQKFPDVIIEDGCGKATDALLQYSDEKIYEKKMNGVRRVMTGETVYDRINFIMKCLNEKVVEYKKIVGIIIPDDNFEKLCIMAENQTYQNKVIIPQKELNEEMFCRCDMIAFFDSQSEYSEFYLEDMVNAFKYTDCDFVTKKAYFENDKLIEGVEHNYVNEYDEIGRTVFWRSSYSFGELFKVTEHASKRGYSIDHFNYRKYL